MTLLILRLDNECQIDGMFHSQNCIESLHPLICGAICVLWILDGWYTAHHRQYKCWLQVFSDHDQRHLTGIFYNKICTGLTLRNAKINLALSAVPEQQSSQRVRLEGGFIASGCPTKTKQVFSPAVLRMWNIALYILLNKKDAFWNC